MASFNEKHYQISELAKLWGLSEDTVRERVKDDPGVIRVGHSGIGRRKRPYIRMTIPESVAARIHAKLTAPFTASQTHHRSNVWVDAGSRPAKPARPAQPKNGEHSR